MTFLAVIEMIITDIDVSRLITHMGEYAKVFRTNQILSLLSVFINGFSTLFMQLSFVRRAYILWGRRWQVGYGLGLLSVELLQLSTLLSRRELPSMGERADNEGD
jgi:hypothetical protein